MTVDKFDHPWGENGSLDTTLTDAKRDVGWISGDSPDRPTIERLNLLENEDQNKINESIDRGPKTLSDDGGLIDTLYEVYSNDNSFACGLQTSNTFDVGGAKRICPAYINGERKLLIANELQRQFKVFDTVTGTIDETVTLSSANFQNSTDEIYDVTADLDYVYVSYTTANDTYVHSFRVGTWVANTNWPATGTLIHSNGFPGNDIIRVNSDFLAVSDPEGSPDLVYLIDVSDGTVSDSGSGDDTSFNNRRIASNGDYLFTSEGGSIDVTNMTNGCGGTGWGVSSLASNVASIGNFIAGVDSNSPQLRLYTTENFNIATASTGDNTKVKYLGPCTFDGVNLWAHGIRTVGATDRRAIFKIDYEWATNENSTTVLARTDLEDLVKIFTFDHAATHSTSTSILNGEDIIFDGRDIWFTGIGVDSDYIWRIPRAQLR